MVSNDNLHHMQRERTIGNDIRLSSTRNGVTQLRPDDLRALKLESPDQMKQLVDLYAGLKLPKLSAVTFAEALLSPNAWFVEAGDVGLIYMTSIVPGWFGEINVAFWDQRLTMNRQEVVKTVMKEAFEKFDLKKISASAPVSNYPLKKFFRKIGFVQEGVLRRMWPSNPPSDLHVLGMLREELECQLVLRPTTSLV